METACRSEWVESVAKSLSSQENFHFIHIEMALGCWSPSLTSVLRSLQEYVYFFGSIKK